MGDRTGIQWTDATWNPIVGCSLKSPGCANCYAMPRAARIERMNGTASAYAGTTKTVNGNVVWTGKLARQHSVLLAPLRWTRPRRVFVNSMGDLFHEDVPDAWIDEVFAVMALAPRHTFQVLTKRSARMLQWFSPSTSFAGGDGSFSRGSKIVDLVAARDATRAGEFSWPPPNVWLGVSVEDQRRADERVPDLLATPAAIRFASAEPLLGPIDFTRWFHDSNCPLSMAANGTCVCCDPRETSLDWIITGDESGPNARPARRDWTRSIVAQCVGADVAAFVKQIVILGKMRKDMADFPSDLRVREYPKPRAT